MFSEQHVEREGITLVGILPIHRLLDYFPTLYTRTNGIFLLTKGVIFSFPLIHPLYYYNYFILLVIICILPAPKRIS